MEQGRLPDRAPLVVALDPVTGERRWQVVTALPPSSPPLADGESLLVAGLFHTTC